MIQTEAPAESCITAPAIQLLYCIWFNRTSKNSKQLHLLQWVSMPNQHYHC